MLDISVAYSRFRFLGHEFLTWLWYMIATGKYTSVFEETANITLSVGDRMILENRHSEEIEMITIKGSRADLKEGKVALGKGALVAELGLTIHVNDQRWRMVLKGESLGITQLKTPVTGRPETEDDLEGTVLEKIHLYETAMDIIDQLYHRFIDRRVSDQWNNRIKADITAWIEAER